jgi:N-acyl-D-amino-acid deacylase
VYLPATRRQLVEIMREMDVSAGEAVLRIVEQENTSAILRFGSEADLVKVLQHPSTAIACDCGASTATHTHPRFYGTFPRVLGHYVRETRALTWADAVRKMTALPASTVGMTDRGLLAPGMAADVTVFDPATVIDHATYDEPARQSDGIRDVVVGGRVALRDGQPTGERGGMVLIRSEHMPSRAFDSGGLRRVSFTGTVGTARIVIDVSQAPSARHAAGTLRLDDPRNTLHGEMHDFGVLQVSDGWASLTGRLTFAGGDERSATVIIDRKNPLAADHGAAIVFDVEAGYRLSGSVAPASVKISR